MKALWFKFLIFIKEVLNVVDYDEYALVMEDNRSLRYRTIEQNVALSRATRFLAAAEDRCRKADTKVAEAYSCRVLFTADNTPSDCSLSVDVWVGCTIHFSITVPVTSKDGSREREELTAQAQAKLWELVAMHVDTEQDGLGFGQVTQKDYQAVGKALGAK